MAVVTFALVFLRVTGVFVTAPVLGGRFLPVQARVALSAGIAYLLSQVVNDGPAVSGPVELVLAGTREVITGMALGFMVMLIFAAVQLAGQVIDMEMGFGLANVMDPLLQSWVPLMGSFYYIIALVLFMSVDGHHVLLMALARSYEVAPIGGFFIPQETARTMAYAARELWRLAGLIAMPVLGAVFLTTVGLGVVSRAVPQMNMFVVGLPVKMLSGSALVLLSLPVVIGILINRFSGMDRVLVGLLSAWGQR
ncbi:MAG: flagellar biosynthetic protein FliR [Bacillota bacterium]